MHTYIAGTFLALASFAAADIGGSPIPIHTERCSGVLAVRDSNGDPWVIRTYNFETDEYDAQPLNEAYTPRDETCPFDESSTGGATGCGHDFYGNDAGERFKSEWDALVGEFKGIAQACEKFNDALNSISYDFENYDDPATDQYVQQPPRWQTAVTRRLHDAGCAISKHDDNLEQFLESFNYPFQQVLRMQNARTAAEDYEDKIKDLQNLWRDERQALVDTMKKHGDTMNRWITAADLAAANHKYADATARLLGGENSAKAEIGKVRSSISKHAVDFEKLAHKLKRDALRWSKLNQIAGEQERLNVLTEIVRMNAYDVLVTCLTNFQFAYTGLETVENA